MSIQYHSVAELESAVQAALDATTQTVIPTVVQTALDLKANAASPTFTGTITTPITASKIVATNASSQLVAASAASAITADVVVDASFTVPSVAVPDTAIQAVTGTSPFGFASADEGNSFLAIVKNLHTRVADLEARLVTQGLLTAS